MLRILDEKYKQEIKQIREAYITNYLLRSSARKLNNNKQFGSLTRADFDYLIENYKKIPIKEIAKKLGKKPNTIKNYAKDLWLSIVYATEDDITLNLLYVILTGKNRDPYSLNLLHKWGLEIQDGFPYLVNINKFYEWYKTHLKLIPLHGYNSGTLPNEPDWFLEKAQADKRAYEYTFKRKWSREQDEQLKKLTESGATYFECSKALKRTGNAIKRRCLDLNIKRPKRTPPNFWTEEQKTKLKTLWLKGYEPCIIAEEIGRSDREIISYLERYKYFSLPPQKFNTPHI